MEMSARKRKRREAGPGDGGSSNGEGSTDVTISMSANSAAALLLGIAAAPGRTLSRGTSPRRGHPDDVTDAASDHRPAQARRTRNEGGVAGLKIEEADVESGYEGSGAASGAASRRPQSRSPSPNNPAIASHPLSDAGSTQSESEEHNSARIDPSLAGTSSQLREVAGQLHQHIQQHGQDGAQQQQHRSDKQARASGYSSRAAHQAAAQSQYQMAPAYGATPALYHHHQQQRGNVPHGVQPVYSYPGQQPQMQQGFSQYAPMGMVYGPPDAGGHRRGQTEYVTMQQAQMAQAYGAPPVRQVTAPKACICCQRTNTPLWRDIGPGRPLCNACGIRWNKYGIICNVCNYVPCKQERQYVQCVRCQAVMPEAVRTRRGGGQKAST